MVQQAHLDGWVQVGEWRLWNNDEVCGYIYSTLYGPAPFCWVALGADGHDLCEYAATLEESKEAVMRTLYGDGHDR